MGKMKEKLRIRFDEDARREYLSGFQKRKKERRKTVVDKKVREQREKKKEFQKQKKAEIEKQLEQYGLLEKDDMKTNPGVQCSEVTEHKEYIHHPHHVVIVDLQPDLSGLLSTSVNSAPQPAGCHEEHKTEHKKKPQKGVKQSSKLTI
ncbi:hypothetical protein EMCRGX_G027938 [Ephydatia muelleri]